MSSSTAAGYFSVKDVYERVVKYLLDKYTPEEAVFHFVALGFGGKHMTSSNIYSTGSKDGNITKREREILMEKMAVWYILQLFI